MMLFLCNVKCLLWILEELNALFVAFLHCKIPVVNMAIAYNIVRFTILCLLKQ